MEEAKIMKKPILASRYLSAGEQLEDGKLGHLCDISTNGIYNALKELLDNPELLKKYSEELSKRDFSNRYEIEKFYGII